MTGSNMTIEERLRRLEALGRASNWDEATIEAQKAKLRAQFAAAAKPDAELRGDQTSRPPRRGGTASAPRPDIDPNPIVAPYRFAALADAVAQPPEPVVAALGDGRQKPSLSSRPLAGGYCGSIVVEWEAETPLLVGEKRELQAGNAKLDVAGPMRAGHGGDWWIPGATFRGMIRAAAEIVGFARLSQTNRHYVFGLRDFVHPYYSAPEDAEEGHVGSPVSRPGAAKGGWLRRSEAGGETSYVIEPAELAYVDIEQLLASGYIGESIGLQRWIESSLETKYKAAGMVSADRRHIDFGHSAKGVPFRFAPAPPDAQGRRRVTPDPRGGIEGTLVFANQTPKKGGSFDRRTAKKVEFVLLSRPGTQRHQRVSPDAWKRFELVHTAPGRNEREAVGSWQILKPLVDAGRSIPIIYVGDLANQDGEKSQFAFGLTRLFKIPHRFGIAAKLDKLQAHRLRRDPEHDDPDRKAYRPDMVEALFGYVHAPREYDPQESEDDPADALKGRIAFSGARIRSTDAQDPVETDVIGTVTMAPRPSFAPFYLAGQFKDWSDPDARLAGRKLYLPRTPADAVAASAEALGERLRHQVAVLPQNARNNLKARSHLMFLRDRAGRPLRFESRIDLHNVTREEIGLVLFVLTHGGDLNTPCRHLIGRAKPFGAGQTRLARLDLKLVENFAPAPAVPAAAAPAAATAAQLEPFLRAFKEHMQNSRTYEGADAAVVAAEFPNADGVREWLGAADPREGAKLKGPQPPVRQPDDGSPPPAHDLYLRLRYIGQRGRDSGPVNPYVELRRATQLLKQAAPPARGRDRLLPAPRAKPVAPQE